MAKITEETLNLQQLYQDFVDKYGMEEKPGEVLPTGSLLLDRALTVGGYGTGRIVELFGPEGAGKTTLGLHALAQAQKKKWGCALIDMECGFDEKYGKAIGLKGKRNVDYMYLVPSHGEEAIDMIQDLLEKDLRFILVDSVAAMVPKAEYEGETGEAFMGLQARMMGQGLRKLTTRVRDAGAVLLFINQVRSKIGVFFGSNETTTGGRALAFYASQRIQVRGGDAIGKTADSQEGRYMRIKIVKNKLGPPLKTCQIPLMYGLGVDPAFEIFDELQVSGKITKRSSFFYFQGEKIGAGRLKSVDHIRQNLATFRKAL